MKEKIVIGGREFLILIEPHELNEMGTNEPREYFTAAYCSTEPASASAEILFTERDKTPKRFASPIEALEYANEKLLGLL